MASMDAVSPLLSRVMGSLTHLTGAKGKTPRPQAAQPAAFSQLGSVPGRKALAGPSIARSAALKARAALMAARESSPPQPPAKGMLGDVDGDGTLTRADGKALMGYLFMGQPAPAGLGNADVNGDGRVDIADMVQLLKMIQESPTPKSAQPTGEPTSTRMAKALTQLRTR
ncbi:MAG: dockerin type I repeat-containing protein [Planctomycetota bacterium]